jgi:hypothetical protein
MLLRFLTDILAHKCHEIILAGGTIRLNEQEFFSSVHVLFCLSLWSAYYAGVREVDDLLDRVLPALSVRGGDGHLPLLVPLLLHP